MIALRVDIVARLLYSPLGPLPCAIGRAGAIAAASKREGDNATPLGRWPIRGVLLRPDRLPAPRTLLPWRWLRPADGWSDDPRDPAYNRAVTHPHPFSAERLWRDDPVYDLIVVLGHNDSPPRPGFGSAIFFHCLPPAGFTAGCVAAQVDDLMALVPLLGPDDEMVVT